jgi:hypothetical protein
VRESEYEREHDGGPDQRGNAAAAVVVVAICLSLLLFFLQGGTTAPAVQGLLVLHGQGRKYFTGANRQDATANFTVLRIVSSCSFNYIEKIWFGLDPKISVQDPTDVLDLCLRLLESVPCLLPYHSIRRYL